MTTLHSIELAKGITAVPSVSGWSDVQVSNLLHDGPTQLGFEAERLSYRDDHDEEKVGFVGKKGRGPGGSALYLPLRYCSRLGTRLACLYPTRLG